VQNSYLDQVDIFLRKLYRDICIFSGKMDGRPVWIIYNAPKYTDGIVTALQKNRFTVFRENSRLSMTASMSHAEFSEIIKNMPDAGKVIFASMRFGQQRKMSMNVSFLKELTRVAQREFGMDAIVFSLPEEILRDDYTEKDLLCRIGGYASSARYIALVISTSTPEPAIPAYNIPEAFRLSYVCTLYDMLTDCKIYSRTVYDLGFSSLPANDQWAISDFPIETSIPAALVEAVKDIMTDLKGEKNRQVRPLFCILGGRTPDTASGVLEFP
jgi:hypothetical protein